MQRALFLGFPLVFLCYFLTRENWYRLLLPMHLFLLPFVSLGARKLLGSRTVLWVLCGCIAAQGLWQYGHGGSSAATSAAEAARIIRQRFPNTDLIIQNSEIYAELPPNPHWLYLPTPGTAELIPGKRGQLPLQDACLPVIRKMTREGEWLGKNQARFLAEKYVYADPSPSCSHDR